MDKALAHITREWLTKGWHDLQTARITASAADGPLDTAIYHCQQAAEKILKALLSDLGVRFRKTHNIRSLMRLIADSGCPLPAELTGLEEFTPFAVAYRYEDYEPDSSLDRDQARLKLRTLRSWVEAKLQERRPGE